MMSDARARLEEGRGLYLILTQPRVTHAELASAACELGTSVIQLREKAAGDEELRRLAGALLEVTRPAGALLIINDRPDIAAATGADGVHLGQRDAKYEVARKLVGPDAIIGLSTHTPTEAESARTAGADYIGAGPVFATETKPDALNPIGTEGLERIAESKVGLPIVAIGGITPATVGEVMAAGAQYAAVISAICHADDPIAALKSFIEATPSPDDRRQHQDRPVDGR